MAKVKIVIRIPDDDCMNCQYWGYDYIEISYQQYKDKYYCKLFDNVELKMKDGKCQRCIACQSCEVE